MLVRRHRSSRAALVTLCRVLRLEAMRHPRHHRGGRSELGQSVVELSFIMPILLFTMLGVADLARLYATVVTTESAARESADLGAFNSSNWVGDPDDPTSNYAKTINAMTERACVATSHLPDYVGTRSTCSNPAVSIALIEADGSTATGCDDPERTPGPCLVRVDLDYTFDVMMPIGLDLPDVHLGVPESISFRRTSIFANSDFELDQ